MVVAEQKTLDVRPGALDDAAREHYARALEFDTSGGLCSLDEFLAGAALFDVLHAGEVVARYALKFDRHAHGVEAVIVAAVGSMPGHDLTASMLPFIECQVAGVRALKVETVRKGLARKLIARGWSLHYVARKVFRDDGPR